MKHLKPKNPFIFVFVPICLLSLLVACSDQQLILSPSIETTQNMTTQNDTYPFTESELYLLDGEVIKEGIVTTVKPANKITFKELLKLLPYELEEVIDPKQKEELLSAYKKSLNKTNVPLPLCNLQVNIYAYATAYSPKPGKTIGCYMTDGFNLNQLNNFRDNFGVSQLYVNPANTAQLISSGWNYN